MRTLILQNNEWAASYLLSSRLYFSFLVLVAITLIVVLTVYYCKTYEDRDSDDAVFIFMIKGITYIFPVVLLLTNARDFIMVWFAPQIWILKSVI